VFARLVRFSIEPESDTKAQALASDIGQLIALQPGCQAVTVFGDHGEGEYGIYVLWDTQENADTAAGVIRPRLNEHLAGSVKAPPETRLFEVLWSN
jgi:hypothetical protein